MVYLSDTRQNWLSILVYTKIWTLGRAYAQVEGHIPVAGRLDDLLLTVLQLIAHEFYQKM
jgi:hypothetical protein